MKIFGVYTEKKPKYTGETIYYRVIVLFGIKIKFKTPPSYRCNKIYLIEGLEKKEISHKFLDKKLKIKVVFKGDNNVLTIYNPRNLDGSSVTFNGSNSAVTFCGYNYGIFNIVLYNNNNIVSIGKYTNCSDMGISSINNEIYIGEDCMISNNVRIWGDGHSVLDAKTKKVINLPQKPITIGNHVWLGEAVVITKNARIPNNCICGIHAVITKSFDEENCLIAGNPASIKKRGIDWNGLGPTDYKKKIEDIQDYGKSIERK